eukprot:scaffold704_cov347-Prasinococcus_capsulatus_cf.AAC.3
MAARTLGFSTKSMILPASLSFMMPRPAPSRPNRAGLSALTRMAPMVTSAPEARCCSIRCLVRHTLHVGRDLAWASTAQARPAWLVRPQWCCRKRRIQNSDRQHTEVITNSVGRALVPLLGPGALSGGKDVHHALSAPVADKARRVGLREMAVEA